MQLLELGSLGVDALRASCATLRAVLAAQAAQLEHLLGELAALVAEAARDLLLDLLRAVERPPARAPARRCGSSCVASASSSAGRRLARRPSASPSTRAGERLPRRQRKDALRGDRRASRAVLCALRLDLRLDLLGVGAAGRPARRSCSARRSASSAWPPRWSRQIARSDLVTPVSAPRMKTVACAVGSRLSVSSGSAPIAFSPGVSSTTRPRLQQRVRVVDQRMAPGRHLDPAVGVERRVVVGTLVVPEAERARLRRRSTHSVRVTSLQRLRPGCSGVVEVERRCASRLAAARAARRATGLRAACRSAAAPAPAARRRRSRARPGTSSCGPAWPAGCGGRCRRRRSR